MVSSTFKPIKQISIISSHISDFVLFFLMSLYVFSVHTASIFFPIKSFFAWFFSPQIEGLRTEIVCQILGYIIKIDSTNLIFTEFWLSSQNVYNYSEILLCTRVHLFLCVYPALQAVAVESQLIPLFLHLLQLLLQLLDLFLGGKKTEDVRDGQARLRGCSRWGELISI